jgi:hypothetical protein
MTRTIQLTLLLLTVFAWTAAASPANWTGPYAPCNRHADLLSHAHMDLGVRFSTSNEELARQFVRALDFWAGILDLEWHEVDSQQCAIQVVDGTSRLFDVGDGCACVAARSQYPDRADFQGWIAFNPVLKFKGNEMFLDAVHEIGHLFGLPHNPSSSSVMFFSDFDQDVSLNAADLEALAARHKLRPGVIVDRSLAVAAR